MEQSRVNSCANCASTAPAGKPHQRCAGCKQTLYCSRDCQKEHWKQHKQFCQQQRDSTNTSAQNKTAGKQPDKDGDDDDDWNDFYEPRRPLAFLRPEPFPELNLSINGSPIAIVDASQFVEETEKKDLTAAHAIATILWNWHPNALRAFLDLEKYSAFEFAIRDSYSWSEKVITHTITRHVRSILGGYYNQDTEWGHQVSYGILANGCWKPLWDSSDGLGRNSRPEFVEKMGGMWAMDQMYLKRWMPSENRTFELTLGRGKVDPASIY